MLAVALGGAPAAVVVGADAGAGLLALLGIYVGAPRAEAWWRARASVRRVARRSRPGSTERVVGTFSQNDRLVSCVGPLPGLDHLLARNGDHAEARKRHVVELVERGGTLLVRKAYRDYPGRPLRERWFAQEVAALERLASVERTPSLVEIDPRAFVLYQTFHPSPTLAAVLDDLGHPRSAQKRVRGLYRGPGVRTDDAEAARWPVLRAVRETVGEDFLAELFALIERVHDAGVLLGDVKYGNVLVARDGPILLDFDMARVHRPTSATFQLARERELDLVRYTFGFEEPA